MPVESELLGHERHDVGLGDRLPAPDRKRVVGIRLSGLVGRDEEVAWNLSHHLQNAFVLDAAGGDLTLDHPGPRSGRRVGIVLRAGAPRPEEPSEKYHQKHQPLSPGPDSESARHDRAF